MSVLSKPTFKTTYSDSSGTFADNTTRLISEGDVRQFAEDIADSVTFGGSINWTTLNIGDWDMDATIGVTVSIGSIDGTKIRSLSAVVRNNADTLYWNLGGTTTLGADIGAVTWQSGSGVILYRTTGGQLDGTDYNATSYNRGWVTIGYVD